MHAIRGLLSAALSVAVMTLVTGQAGAAAFHLYEKSVMAAGRGYAGVSAATDDVGIVVYNPAGMTELGGPSFGAGIFDIMPKGKLSDAGSNLSIGPFGPFPVTGDSRGQGFDPQISGYFYGAAPIGDRLWVGMSVSAPFGLKAEYDDDFFGRYDSLKSSLVVFEFAPSVAYRLGEQVSIGGSLDIQRASATLTNALPNPLDPDGPNPASDGLLSIKGHDWTLGFQLGLHVRPSDQMEIGLTYRNGVTHRLEGAATTEFGGATSVMGAMADLKLPNVITLGTRFRATDRLNLLAEVNRFGWSRFDRLRVVFEDTTEAVTQENFRNTWGAAVGGDYAASRALTLRTGLIYEKTPTRDATRSTRIPDTNRLWASVGASYAFNARWNLDVSYMHLFAKSGLVNREGDFPALGTTVHTTASTKTSSNVLGLGLRARF